MLASTVETQNIILFCLVSYSFIVFHRRDISFQGTTLFRKFFLGAYVPMYTMEVCTYAYVLSMTRMMRQVQSDISPLEEVKAWHQNNILLF